MANSTCLSEETSTSEELPATKLVARGLAALSGYRLAEAGSFLSWQVIEGTQPHPLGEGVWEIYPYVWGPAEALGLGRPGS